MNVEGDPDELGGSFLLQQFGNGHPLFIMEFRRPTPARPVHQKLVVEEVVPDSYSLCVGFDTPAGRTLASAALRVLSAGAKAMHRLKLAGRGFETDIAIERGLLPLLADELRELGGVGEALAAKIQQAARTKCKTGADVPVNVEYQPTCRPASRFAARYRASGVWDIFLAGDFPPNNLFLIALLCALRVESDELQKQLEKHRGQDVCATLDGFHVWRLLAALRGIGEADDNANKLADEINRLVRLVARGEAGKTT